VKIINLKDAPEHLEKLAEWHQCEWAALNPGSSLQDRIDKMRGYLEDDFIPGTYIALGQELAGSAAIIKYDMDSRKDLSPWLASVYVRSDQRRKGIGTQLVKHVMSEARKAGLKHLYLFTPDQVSFYRQLGWQVLERARYHNHDIVIMHVDL